MSYSRVRVGSARLDTLKTSCRMMLAAEKLLVRPSVETAKISLVRRSAVQRL